ncbi:phospholipase A2 inhibitor NAI-like [Mixophyes fleayi]|uniref:phospholipase A2 inhibitor NAI-like n=1 Tax=Mixophyes fleayi TaxID=3061075 RepID=UPI003F4D85F2
MYVTSPHEDIKSASGISHQHNSNKENIVQLTPSRMKFSYIGALCVFMTVIAAAECITCNQCLVLGAEECCSVKDKECPGTQCMTISEYCIADDIEYSSMSKTCGSDELCGQSFTLTTGLGFEARASNQCGEGDGSNANLNFTKSSGELLPNGYTCPRCYAKDSIDGCEDNGTVECLGKESECVYYRGTVQIADSSIRKFSLKGCIVPGGCKIGFSGLPGSKEMKKEIMECVPAKRKNDSKQYFD